MIGLYIITIIGVFFAGYHINEGLCDYEKRNGKQYGILFLIIGLTVLMNLIYFMFNERNHSLWGTMRPKYYKMENVTLPDGTNGRIDDVYYLIEGNLVAQDSLTQD